MSNTTTTRVSIETAGDVPEEIHLGTQALSRLSRALDVLDTITTAYGIHFAGLLRLDAEDDAHDVVQVPVQYVDVDGLTGHFAQVSHAL